MVVRFADTARALPELSRDSLELASLASSGSGKHTSGSSSPSGISSSRKQSLEGDDPLGGVYGSRNTRSYSVSSAFDFGSALFPLSQTAGGYAPLGAPSALSLDRAGGTADGSLERHKTLTYLNGLSLIIGPIIGSGIFSSPGSVSANVGSAGASLIVWVIAGMLAWTGATSYAELGGAIPLNGGAQVYLAKIFGELAGFLFSWCAIFVLKPGSAAIVSIIFGEYIVRAIVGPEMENVNPWITKGVAIAILCLVTALNCVSTRLATRVGDFFMFFKFITLLAITVVGIIASTTGLSYHSAPNREWKTKNWFEGTSKNPSNWALAVYAGLWAFDGWDNTNYVTGEFKNPNRDLPRVIHSGMPLVILCYLLANVSYFFVLPFSTLMDTHTVGVQFGHKIFGPIGSLVLALVVCGSCFGSLNASTFTSGRLVYSAGKEGYFPTLFGRLGFRREDSLNNVGDGRLRRRSCLERALQRIAGDEVGLGYTPIYAMCFNMMLGIGYALSGDFDDLLTFYGVAGYTFYFLTVLGLIVLRVREPELERPYKTWIMTPIVFCCVSLFLLSRSVFVQPLQALMVVGFIVVGVPVYFWRIAVRDGKEGWWKIWKR